MDGTAETRLARIEAILDKIDHELFGNGQPGAIAQHAARITAIEHAIREHPLTCEAPTQILRMEERLKGDDRWHKRLEPYFQVAFRLIIIALLFLIAKEPGVLKALTEK